MPIAQWNVRKTTSPYQQWSGYPQSPILPNGYVKQLIFTYWGGVVLMAATLASNYYIRTDGRIACDYVAIAYKLVSGAWVRWSAFDTVATGPIAAVENMPENNVPFYTDNTFSAILKNKTTTPDQDAGIQTQLVRIS